MDLNNGIILQWVNSTISIAANTNNKEVNIALPITLQTRFGAGVMRYDYSEYWCSNKLTINQLTLAITNKNTVTRVIVYWAIIVGI